jgi:curved DNA-binding protein CbpA
MPRAEAAGAASVVTELLGFLKEPTRHRSRYTHGRETLEGGHHMLRFAQGKFPPGVLHDMPTHRRAELREAAQAFIRQVCFWEGATHYQVLCVPSRARREAIKENYHLLMALIHPDRSEGAAQAWPSEWPQRANQAYAVLSDDALRATYDASLRTVGSIPPSIAQAPKRDSAAVRRRPGRFSRLQLRLAKAVLAFGAIIATLLLLEAWYGETPREYTLFQGLAAMARKGGGSDHPRYLGSGVFRAPDAPASSVAPVSARERSNFAPSTGGDAAVAVRVANASPKADVIQTVAIAASEPAREPTPPSERAPPAQGARESSPVDASHSLRAAMFVAQAPAAPERAPTTRPTSDEIESLVVRLIGYYEAGEADQLMGLLANDDGFWQTARIRQSYLEFFRATKERRLRVDKLDWQTAALSAHARGEATLQAEFFEESRALERRVDVELDIGLRDGEVKITRLRLYPNAP